MSHKPTPDERFNKLLQELGGVENLAKAIGFKTRKSIRKSRSDASRAVWLA